MPEHDNIPGFKDLPLDEQIIIDALKDNPIQNAVFTMTKVSEIRQEQMKMQRKCTATHKTVDKRIDCLFSYKNKIMGALAVIVSVAAVIKIIFF